MTSSTHALLRSPRFWLSGLLLAVQIPLLAQTVPSGAPPQDTSSAPSVPAIFGAPRPASAPAVPSNAPDSTAPAPRAEPAPAPLPAVLPPAYLSASLRQRLEEAKALQADKRFHKASVALYELLQDGLPTQTAAEVRFNLGQCLEVIGLPSMAIQYYRDALRYGPAVGAVYGQSLQAWARLGLEVDDTAELMARLATLPPAADPPSPVLRYFRGVLALQRNRLDEARKLLKEVEDPETVLGRQARYSLAVTVALSGDRAAAIKLFEPLLEGKPRGLNGELSPQEAELVERIRSLTLISLARMRYAQERFLEAADLYGQVPADSPERPYALQELAWTAFWEDKALEGVNTLASLRLGAPANTSRAAFIPDGELLAALFYLRTGQHDLADGVLRTYLDQLYNLRVAVRDFAKVYSAPELASEALRIAYGAVPALPQLVPPGEAPAPTATPKRDPVQLEAANRAISHLKPILEAMRRDRELSQALGRAAQCQLTFHMFNKQPQWWRETTLGRAVTPTLLEAEEKALEAGGRRMQVEIGRYRVWLSEVNVQALALRKEVTAHRMAKAENRPDPDPYTGTALPPFDFIHP